MTQELREKASVLEGLLRSSAWEYMAQWLSERREQELRRMTKRMADDGDRFWAAAAYNVLGEVLEWPAREAAWCRDKLEEEAVNA